MKRREKEENDYQNNLLVVSVLRTNAPELKVYFSVETLNDIMILVTTTQEIIYFNVTLEILTISNNTRLPPFTPNSITIKFQYGFVLYIK